MKELIRGRKELELKCQTVPSWLPSRLNNRMPEEIANFLRSYCTCVRIPLRIARNPLISSLGARNRPFGHMCMCVQVETCGDGVPTQQGTAILSQHSL